MGLLHGLSIYGTWKAVILNFWSSTEKKKSLLSSRLFRFIEMKLYLGVVKLILLQFLEKLIIYFHTLCFTIIRLISFLQLFLQVTINIGLLKSSSILVGRPPPSPRPLMEWLKWNINAFRITDKNLTSIGLVCRDTKGCIIASLGKKFADVTILVAEAITTRSAQDS